MLRRYEFYKYTGRLNLADGEALCEDPTKPSCVDNGLPGQSLYGVGDFIGAQNAAVNLNGNPLAVPEPQTWAMLLAGLGIVCWVSQRRSASSRE